MLDDPLIAPAMQRVPLSAPLPHPNPITPTTTLNNKQRPRLRHRHTHSNDNSGGRQSRHQHPPSPQVRSTKPRRPRGQPTATYPSHTARDIQSMMHQCAGFVEVRVIRVI